MRGLVLLVNLRSFTVTCKSDGHVHHSTFHHDTRLYSAAEVMANFAYKI